MLLLFFFGLCIDVFIASGFMSWLTSGRFIAPVIEELSKQYPDVTTYKIDIDEVCISIFNWVSVKLFIEHECVTMCLRLS